MKKRIVIALFSLLIAGMGIGMGSLPHQEQPVSTELLAEAQDAKEPDVVEEEEEEPEEIIEEKICEEGCTLEPGHEGNCVLEEKKDIQVVLKSTSVERDLKVKFVNQANGKVISGADFKIKLTGPSKKTKEYSDHDQDGIIWVKDIDGGNYTVEMLELEGYVTAKTLKAEVKKKIEYKVIEVAEEVKKESQIEVSKEDAAYGGTSKDESTSESSVPQDTVEFVASTKKENVKQTDVQKKDKFNQLVYEKQKLDELGQPMYAKILRESAKFHQDTNKDNLCDRCGESLIKCTEHVDKDRDLKCDTCKATVDESAHQHYDDDKNCVCDAEKCKKALEHQYDEDAATCKVCGTSKPSAEGGSETSPEGGSATPPEGGSETPPEGEAAPSTVPTSPAEGESEGETTAPPSSDPEGEQTPVAGIVFRPFFYLRAAEEKPFIEYDTTSAPVYDTTSAPVYETEVTYSYTGWQTIDGATYFFDKNGNKVTGQQVIEGVSYTFSSEGVRSGTIGIDVSKYQTGIDWSKVKNAGINFVMIRCGYRGYGSGVLVEDPMYASHIQGAKAAGLRVGVYFFSQAINEAEAVEEASMAVTLARKYGINMPIAIDSEYAAGGRGRADGLSTSERTTVTKAFCNTVQSAGYTPMVYASKSWFGSKLDTSQLSGFRIWVAHYAEQCGYTGTYHIWQNTSKGKVDGVPGYVDMNISSI